MAPAVGAVVGLALVAVAAFGSLAALREANAWESHTRDVLRHSADLESTFLVMVAELRAYRADGDTTSLTSYGAAREELAREYDALRALVADDAAQVARLDRLRALTDTWQAEVAEPVLRAAPGATPAVAPGRRSELVGAVRAQRQAFTNVELALLAERDTGADRALRQTIVAIGAALVLELLLLLATGVLAVRSITRPLDRLAAAARRWARGELDARVGLDTRDELGLVGRAFDDMAERLGADRGVLVAAHREHRLLRELNARLISDDPSTAPLHRGLAVFCEQLDLSAVAVWWQQGEMLTLLAENGLLPAAEGRTQPRALGEGLVGRVAATGQEVVIADAQAAPEAEHARPWLAAGGLHSVVALPMADTEGVRGTLLLAGPSPQPPDAETLAVLRVAAQRLTFVIERRAVRARLEEANRALERATRAKSDFLATMSHELRTPLNSIIGFSDLLLDDLGEDAEAVRRRRYVSHIHESGRHLLNLVNDILDLAKVEAGRMDVHASTFEVADSLRAVDAVIRPLAERKELTLTTVVAPEVGTLHADEGKLKQVLYNLLANAVKFTPSGGRVETTARVVDGAVEIAVTDSGIGIAPEDQARVFDEFQQLDAGAGRRHEGTGLGLALARRLVELQGGRLWVDSELGQGSRFTFTVPLPVAQSLAPQEPGDGLAPARPAELAEMVGRRATGRERANGAGDAPLVLVIEDDAGARELLTAYLAQGGYRAATVTSGANAVEQARALRPAAITLDVMLPGRDGWEVLQALKADPATADVPVVIVSVVDNEHLGYALGAAAYLVKPIAQPELLRALERLCSSIRAAARGSQPPTALVVDDEARARELVSAYLQPAGFRVLEAPSGEEGVALAASQRPDVVLLDLMMPGLSGFEVVERLKADAATRDIPIIILTAKDLTAADRATLNGHIVAVMTKAGVTRERFLAELECVLGPPAAPAVAIAGAGGGER